MACAKEAQEEKVLFESMLFEDQLWSRQQDLVTFIEDSIKGNRQKLNDLKGNSPLVTTPKSNKNIPKRRISNIKKKIQNTNYLPTLIDSTNKKNVTNKNKTSNSDKASNVPVSDTNTSNKTTNATLVEGTQDANKSVTTQSPKLITGAAVVANTNITRNTPEVAKVTKLKDTVFGKSKKASKKAASTDATKKVEKKNIPEVLPKTPKNTTETAKANKLKDTVLNKTSNNASKTASNDIKKEVKDVSETKKVSETISNNNKPSSVSIQEGVVNPTGDLSLNDEVDSETITYEIPEKERRVAALFTDPSAHNKRAKRTVTVVKNKPKTAPITAAITKKAVAKKIVTVPVVEPVVEKETEKPISNNLNTNQVALAKPVLESNIPTTIDVPTKKPEKKVAKVTVLKNKTIESLEIPSIKSNITTNNKAINTANNITAGDLSIRLLRKESTYQTNKNYTLLVEVLNNGDAIDPIKLETILPTDWKVISISALGSLGTNERKLVMISFFIPAESLSGTTQSTLILKSNNYILHEHTFDLVVAKNYELEVFNISGAQQIQAGETFKAKFGVRNNGNVDQEVVLESRNSIKGSTILVIPRDSTVVVEVLQKSDSKLNMFRTYSANLDVLGRISNQKYYNSQSYEVIPTKITQKDPYLRYPIRASLYYNSYTNQSTHYSTLSAELMGNGYLDEARDHHLNFTFRAPKQEDIRRFSIVDQYSLIYRYKNKTELYLGDHSYNHNRLGFTSRYGMGFKLSHTIDKWTLSTFYSKPRLYSYNRKALFGVRADYNLSDNQNVGLTLERSQGNIYTYRNIYNIDGKGQIATLDYDFEDKNTSLSLEMSTSFNGSKAGYATDINFNQGIGDFRYNSAIIYAGKDYFGKLSNSFQFSNSLYFYKKGFNAGFGHSFSQVNRRLDPLLFETEPYYENYFATVGYRFTNKHYFSFRFDKREREDQLEPKNYHYGEYGVNYNFVYTDKLFTGSFGGRFGKTENKLVANSSYRNTYSNNLNVSYKLFKNFSLRGGLNHIYTSRYGTTYENISFVRYNVGVNHRISRNLRFNANYNSGFSPEESYKQREYINFNLVAQLSSHHRLEMRANYFERPGIVDQKELFAYAKYTYSFGVGVKKIIEQGGVEGAVFTNNSDIDVTGIKLYSAGKTIVTDKNGNFEINNLPVGTNYLFIDDESLPLNVVSMNKKPIEIEIQENRKASLNIELVKAGTVVGKLVLNNILNVIESNLESYVKLENENFTYYAEASKEGNFRFRNIVPGEYTFTLIRFKKNEKFFSLVKETNVTVKPEVGTELNITVNGKEKKIKFKDTNLKVGYNE